MPGVKLTDLIEKMDLKNLTPDIDLTGKYITVPDINRPALQLTGYFDHFYSERIQIIGYVEYTYLEHLNREQKIPVYEKFLSYGVPCIIYTTMTEPDEDMCRLAEQYQVPIFTTIRMEDPSLEKLYSIIPLRFSKIKRKNQFFTKSRQATCYASHKTPAKRRWVRIRIGIWG